MIKQYYHQVEDNGKFESIIGQSLSHQEKKMVLKRRNFTALAAIMHNNEAHNKTNKAKCQKQKQALKKKIRAESFGSFLLQMRKLYT